MYTLALPELIFNWISKKSTSNMCANQTGPVFSATIHNGNAVTR